MKINWGKLDEVNKTKYLEFQDEVELKLRRYKRENPGRFMLVESILDSKGSDWDRSISIDRNGETEDIDITNLLVYEYCSAIEKITQERINFAEALAGLTKKLDKFRIGNPVKGEDDECLYARNLEDENGIPVTSKLYRLVMSAEAQTLGYIEDGKYKGAVFLYQRDRDENFLEDEQGNPVPYDINGIDFYHIEKGQSLLNNLRQTAFHEWNHISEREFLDVDDLDAIEHETKTPDGKVHINYDDIQSYYTSEDIDQYEEPTYVITSQKDRDGRFKRYYKDEDGSLKPFSDIKFGLSNKTLEEPIHLSTGLKTEEIDKDDRSVIHNRITEGFVEYIAREMVKTVSSDEDSLALGRYHHEVEIAKNLIQNRDKSIDSSEEGNGKTIADFLSHSSVLKKELEERTVELDDGRTVNGLQYVQDRAEDEFLGRNAKTKFFRETMPNIVRQLELTREQVEGLQNLHIERNKILTKEVIQEIYNIAAGNSPIGRAVIDAALDKFSEVIEKEAQEKAIIAERVGYKPKEKEVVKEAAKEVTEEVTEEVAEEVSEDMAEEENKEVSKNTKEESESNKGEEAPKESSKGNEDNKMAFQNSRFSKDQDELDFFDL